MANTPNPYVLIVKLALYVSDVLSDWINGVNQLMHSSKVLETKVLNQTLTSEDSNLNCTLKLAQRQLVGGYLTIGLSWLPGLVAILAYFDGSQNLLDNIGRILI